MSLAGQEQLIFFYSLDSVATTEALYPLGLELTRKSISPSCTLQHRESDTHQSVINQRQ